MNVLEAHAAFNAALHAQAALIETGVVDLTAGVVDIRESLCPTCGQPVHDEVAVSA